MSRGHLKVLNDTVMIMSDPLNNLVLIWYYSKPSEVPYYPNHNLDRDFLCHFLHQGGSSSSMYGEVLVLDIFECKVVLEGDAQNLPLG